MQFAGVDKQALAIEFEAVVPLDYLVQAIVVERILIGCVCLRIYI